MIIEEDDEVPVLAVQEAVMVSPRIAPPAIPVAEPVSTASGVSDSGLRHKVKSGDSIWGITRRYKVEQEALLELNGLADPNKLRAGMELKIPASN